MGEAVRRVSTALNAGDGNEDLYASALHRSFVMSADMAHAVHPNYAVRYMRYMRYIRYTRSAPTMRCASYM